MRPGTRSILQTLALLLVGCSSSSSRQATEFVVESGVVVEYPTHVDGFVLVSHPDQGTDQATQALRNIR